MCGSVSATYSKAATCTAWFLLRCIRNAQNCWSFRAQFSPQCNIRVTIQLPVHVPPHPTLSPRERVRRGPRAESVTVQ